MKKNTILTLRVKDFAMKAKGFGFIDWVGIAPIGVCWKLPEILALVLK